MLRMTVFVLEAGQGCVPAPPDSLCGECAMMTERAARAALTCTNTFFASLALWATMTIDRCPGGRLPPKLGMNHGYPKT